MLKVDLTEVIYTGEPKTWLSTTFSSVIDDVWLAEFNLLDYNQQPAIAILDSIESIICNLRINPEKYTPEDADESLVTGVREWLGEIYSAAYNHPESIINVVQV